MIANVNIPKVAQWPPFFVSAVAVMLMTSPAAIEDASAQNLLPHEYDHIRVLFYNTENLFDTIDTPDKRDEEYTPQSKLGHTTSRYRQKLTNLAKVIDSSFVNEAPSFLGLCEVENAQVVLDLVDQVSIPHHFSLIHFESPDQRGIDNALLYDTAQFTLKESGLAQIDLGPDERPTRGIS